MRTMDLSEFLDLGLLQELNRRFLHPIGLAIEVVVDENGKATHFGRIWDYRDDPEGLCFGSFSEQSLRKKETVDKMFEEKREAREQGLGYHVQPLEVTEDKDA